MKGRGFLAVLSGAVVALLVGPLALRAASTGTLEVRSSLEDYEYGQMIDWTVDWTDHAPADVDRDDVVVSLDGPHEFAPGSVQVPRGWSVTYSSDGETFTEDVPSEVSHLKFSYDASIAFPPAVASIAEERDILVQTPMPRPIPPITTARNGGDGYIPILAGDRIYSVWHHLAAGANPEPHVVCVDTITGKTCPDYPKPLGWQTSYNQGQGIFINNRIYIKNRDATTHGVFCWDTRTEDSCGYFPVANLGPVTGTAGGNGGWDQFSSPVLHKGRMFFAGHNHRVYCFDPATEAVCGDYGLDGKPSARFGEAHATTRRLNDVVYHDGRMIFSLATSWADGPIPLGTKDFCFDLDAGAPCAGWGVNGVVTENAGTAYLFLRRDASGSPTGFCHGVQSGAGEVPLQASVPCYDFDGKNRSTIPSVQPFGQFRPYNVEEDTLGTRTFFGRYSTNGAYCYDWATSAPCTGTYFDVNGRSTQSVAEHFYGFVARGQCMIGLGHRGIFVSVDPVTGASPCRNIADVSRVVSASSRYCRDTKNLDNWRIARVSDTSSADFSRMVLTVSDGTNSVSGNMLTGDLSLESLSTSRDLWVGIDANLNPSADPWKTGIPMVNLLYGGSSQFCFQTVAKAPPVPEPDPTPDPEPDPKPKPIVIEVESNGVVEKEEVVPDPTPSDIGEPDESGTFVDPVRLASLTTLPATGSGPNGAPIAWAVAAVLAGGAAVSASRRRRATRGR